MTMDNMPSTIPGGFAIDDRGILSYLNNVPLALANVKRMYIVENFDTKTIRAFHGHLKEEKIALVVSGSSIVNVSRIRLENGAIAGLDAPTRFILSARKPQFLIIPAGYANGWRALTPDTKIMFFSSTTLEESEGDDHRWPLQYFVPDIWEVENR